MTSVQIHHELPSQCQIFNLFIYLFPCFYSYTPTITHIYKTSKLTLNIFLKFHSIIHFLKFVLLMIYQLALKSYKYRSHSNKKLKTF